VIFGANTLVSVATVKEEEAPQSPLKPLLGWLGGSLMMDTTVAQTGLEANQSTRAICSKERKSQIEDRRLQRDAKRSRGEELYHLFDSWLVGIREAAGELTWKIQTGGHTLKHIEAAFGDQSMYRRIVMLSHIDFPAMSEILEPLGRKYTTYGGVLNTIGAEPDAELVVPSIEEFIKVLNSTGDEFEELLLSQMKALYD
jgi:hypothetical protein